MKPLIYLLISLVVLTSLATAELSQEDAALVCQDYLSLGESISVSGPLTCDGFYWICNVEYYGNRLPVLFAVDQFSGEVVDVTDRDLLEDIIRTKYALDAGAQTIFNTVATDSNFLIQLQGLNSSLVNYQNVLEALKTNRVIDPILYLNLSDQIEANMEELGSLLNELFRLTNESAAVFTKPECYKVDGIITSLEKIGPRLENFTDSWLEFIIDYNTMAAAVSSEFLVTQINPSNAQIMARDVAGVSPAVEAYMLEEEDYISKVVGNTGTRIRRKLAKDVLEDALAKVQDANIEEATKAYNGAVEAFEDGNYAETERLAREAISIVAAGPSESDEPTVIIEEAPDYTMFFIAIAVLIVILIIVMFYRRTSEGEFEEEYNDVEESKKPEKSRKKPKRKSWGWTKD